MTLADELREVTGLHSFAELFGFSWNDGSDWTWHDVACTMADRIESVDKSCAACPQMGDPESFISELSRRLDWYEKNGTCKVFHPNCSDFNYACDKCGEQFSTCHWPEFCPGCGRSVKP